MSRYSALLGIVLATAALGTFLVMSRENPAPPAPTSSSSGEPAAKSEPSLRESPVGETRTPLAPDLRAIVHGRCVDEDGEPLANVPVSLQGWPSSTPALELFQREHGAIAWQDPPDALSDAEGRFAHRFDPPPPFRFRVTAMVLGRVRVYQRWSSHAPGSSTDLGDLVLVRGVAVLGVLVDEQGAGVAERSVMLAPVERRLPPTGDELRRFDSASVRSDARGGFVVEDPLPTGAYRISVDGCRVLEPQSTVAIEPPRAELRIVVRPSPPDTRPRIAGVVVDLRGSPIGGARLEVDRHPTPFLMSRRDGAFELRRDEGLPAEGIRLGIARDGYESWRSAEPIAWGTEDLHVVLEPGPSLTVGVRRFSDDTPIEDWGLRLERLRDDGAWVQRHQDLEDPFRHPGGVLEIERFSSGHWRLEVLPEESTGLPSSRFVEFDAAPKQSQSVAVRIAGLAQRVVEVLDPRGNRVCGVCVELLEHQRGGEVTLGMGAYEPRTARINQPDRAAILHDTATTDSAGRVTLRAPGDGSYAVRLPGPGNVPLLVQPVRLDDPTPLRLVVGLGATLRGHIEPREVYAALRSDAGIPLGEPLRELGASSMPALCLRGRGSRHGEVYPADTRSADRLPLAEDGSFTLAGIPPGAWDVCLRTNLYDPATRSSMGGTRVVLENLELADGDDRELVLDLRSWLPRDVKLDIRVDGKPHSGRVALAGETGTGPDGRPEEQTRYTTSAADGTLAIALPMGTWTPSAAVRFEPGSYWLTAPRFAVGETPPLAPILCDVRTASRPVLVLDSDGKPLADLRLVASTDEPLGSIGSRPTDAAGKTTLFGWPVTARLSTRRAPMRSDDAFHRWTREHPGDREAWSRAMLEIGTVDLLPGGGEEFVIRLPPEWREAPR